MLFKHQVNKILLSSSLLIFFLKLYLGTYHDNLKP